MPQEAGEKMLDYRGGTGQPFRLALDQMIPMRDGVKLSGDIYLPNEGENFPVALLRTISGNQEPRYMSWTKAFVKAGYAVVLQVCRGGTTRTASGTRIFARSPMATIRTSGSGSSRGAMGTLARSACRIRASRRRRPP